MSFIKDHDCPLQVNVVCFTTLQRERTMGWSWVGQGQLRVRACMYRKRRNLGRVYVVGTKHHKQVTQSLWKKEQRFSYFTMRIGTCSKLPVESRFTVPVAEYFTLCEDVWL